MRKYKIDTVISFNCISPTLTSTFLPQHKKSQTLDNLSYLAYLYGEDDSIQTYEIVAPENFVTFPEGVSKNYHLLPPHIRKKLDGKIKLSESEESGARAHAKALQKAAADMMKTAESRPNRIEAVQELHDLFTMQHLGKFISCSILSTMVRNEPRKRKSDSDDKECRPQQKMPFGQEVPRVSDASTAVDTKGKEVDPVNEDDKGGKQPATDRSISRHASMVSVSGSRSQLEQRDPVNRSSSAASAVDQATAPGSEGGSHTDKSERSRSGNTTSRSDNGTTRVTVQERFQELHDLFTVHSSEKFARCSSRSIMVRNAAQKCSGNGGDKDYDPQEKKMCSPKAPRGSDVCTAIKAISKERDTVNEDDEDRKLPAIDRSISQHASMIAASGSSSQLEQRDSVNCKSSSSATAVDKTTKLRTEICSDSDKSKRSWNGNTTSSCDNGSTRATVQVPNVQAEIVTRNDPVFTFYSHSKAIVQENMAFRLHCMRLETEILALQKENRKLLEFLQQYDTSSDNSSDDDAAVSSGNVTQWDEIVAPALCTVNENYVRDFAAYLQAVEDQNMALQRRYDQVSSQLDNLKVSHSQLSEEVTRWKVQYDALMNCRKELTKKARESLNA